MIIKLNVDLLKYKKGCHIDLDKIAFKEQQYFNRRIKDSKIDNCLEIINNQKENKVIEQKEKIEKKNIETKKEEEKEEEKIKKNL